MQTGAAIPTAVLVSWLPPPPTGQSVVPLTPPISGIMPGPPVVPHIEAILDAWVPPPPASQKSILLTPPISGTTPQNPPFAGVIPTLVFEAIYGPWVVPYVVTEAGLPFAVVPAIFPGPPPGPPPLTIQQTLYATVSSAYQPAFPPVFPFIGPSAMPLVVGDSRGVLVSALANAGVSLIVNLAPVVARANLITAATLSLVEEGGADTSPTSRVVGSPVIVGQTVRQTLTNLVSGGSYIATVAAEFSDGTSRTFTAPFTAF